VHSLRRRLGENAAPTLKFLTEITFARHAKQVDSAIRGSRAVLCKESDEICGLLVFTSSAVLTLKLREDWQCCGLAEQSPPPVFRRRSACWGCAKKLWAKKRAASYGSGPLNKLNLRSGDLKLVQRWLALKSFDFGRTHVGPLAAGAGKNSGECCGGRLFV
jgi:hypothetical protein